MKLVIVSICLNEEKTIKELLRRMPKKIDGVDDIKIVVIDDGSMDNTAKFAREMGAEVFSNGTQKRLAYSFQKAVDIALKKGADVVVNIDGDLQYSPEEIPLIVKPVIEGKADFAAADRFTDAEGNRRKRPENMPLGNFLGNRLGSWIISKLSHKKFTDVTSGFRAYNRLALMSLNINGKYTYTQESFQVLAMKNITVAQVPVTIKYFPGRKSRVVSSITKFITNSAINILRSFRDFAPLVFFGWIGGINLVAGSALSGFTLVHYLLTGSFSPYKYIGLAGLFLVAIGIVIWIVGLVGDMLDRVLNNQEKTIFLLKELKYSRLKEEDKR